MPFPLCRPHFLTLGQVTHIELRSGQTLPADAVFVATGSLPNTDWLQSSDIPLTKYGSIETDSFLKSDPHVFVAGDISSFPYRYLGQNLNSQHYSEAISQGSHAAWNMMGKYVPYQTVPFYWTRAFNKSLAFVGISCRDSEVVIKGEPAKLNFIAYYFDSLGRLTGAAGMGHNYDLIAINQAMRMGMRFRKEEVVAPDFDWKFLKERIAQSGKSCRCQRKCNMEK